MTSSTVAQILAQIARELARSAVETPELDAELLVAYSLGVDRAWLIAHAKEPLTPEQETSIRAVAARRARREPMAYITGRRWFYDIELWVTPAVLIPRPETEELVERALTWLRQRPRAVVADIGTGSGAIALTITKHTPADVHILATDISSEALAVARENARRLGLISRVHFCGGDLLAALPQPVDLLLANLPYVAERDAPELMPEVKRFEPPQALFSGPAGLDHLRRLLTQAPDFLRPQGAILLEIGWNQGDEATQLARQRFPHARIHLHQDLSGHDRILEIDTSS